VSDFLSRLAERSAGTPPALRPRVPSTFEPWPAGDPMGDAPPTFPPPSARPTQDGAPPLARTAQAVRERRLVSAAPPADSRETVADATDDRAPTAPRVRTHRAMPVRMSAPAAADAEPRATAPPERTPAQARHEAPHESASPRAPASPAPAIAAQPPQPNEGAAAPPAPDTPAPAAEPSPRTARSITVRAPHPDATAEPLHELETAAGRPATAVSARRAVAGPAPTPGRAGDAPLTVEVTVGRFEVRAAPAPPTGAARRPAPAPRLTLDEYLCERTGAGRR
jgi:DNA polymerase III subunit gamma/tau